MKTNHNIKRLNCIIICSACLFSACAENKSNSPFTNKITDTPVTKTQKNITTEYIIVLRKNVALETAIKNLKQYDVLVVKDMKRQRYVIKLKNAPDINYLKKHILSSKHVEHIQPNFGYTTQ